MLATLAACGQQAATSRQPTSHVAVTHGNYHRPASYDPPGPTSDPWGPYIREASRRFDVPERWIREVMRQESAGRVSATSPVGAMGLMQVMPGTYREMQSRYGLGDDPYHPYDSIMAGAAYIREMYDLYGSPAFLAAYNAGPRRLEDYLWNSRGLPNETRNYVARIGPHIIDHHPHRRVAPEIYAAAEIPLNIPPGPRRMDSATMLALREQRQALDPGIRVAQLPAGPVVRMEPIPDGSTVAQGSALGMSAGGAVAAPVQIASLDNGPVVRMEPIPDGSTPEGARALGAESRSAAPPPAALPLPTPARVAVAAPPPPPAPLPAPPRAMAAVVSPVPVRAPAAAPAPATRGPARPTVLASAAAATPPLPLPAPQPMVMRTLGLVGTAQASALPAALRPDSARPAAVAGAWAVQVGAFASQNLARSAAQSARGAGPAGQVMVQPVASGRSTLYRARVTGLSQSAAQAVCERLRRSGACMVLSPDAQS